MQEVYIIDRVSAKVRPGKECTTIHRVEIKRLVSIRDSYFFWNLLITWKQNNCMMIRILNKNQTEFWLSQEYHLIISEVFGWCQILHDVVAYGSLQLSVEQKKPDLIKHVKRMFCDLHLMTKFTHPLFIQISF